VYADWLADSLHIFVQHASGEWEFRKFVDDKFVLVEKQFSSTPFKAPADCAIFQWFINNRRYNHHPSAACFRTLLVGLDAYPKEWPQCVSDLFIAPLQLEGIMVVARDEFHSVVLSKYTDLWMVKRWSSDCKCVESKTIAIDSEIPQPNLLFYLRDVATKTSHQLEDVGDVIELPDGLTATVIKLDSASVTFRLTSTAVPLKSICDVLHHSLGTQLVVSSNDITWVVNDFFAKQTLQLTVNEFDIVQNLQFVVVPKPQSNK
jgi:hypothetical protein